MSLNSLFLLQCMGLLMLSVISLLRSDSVAFGCEADMQTVDRSNQSDVNDPQETLAGLNSRSAAVSTEVCYHGRHRAVKRRDFMALLGGAAATWPLGPRAQPSASRPLVGILSPLSAGTATRNIEGFRTGLRAEARCRVGRTALVHLL